MDIEFSSEDERSYVEAAIAVAREEYAKRFQAKETERLRQLNAQMEIEKKKLYRVQDEELVRQVLSIDAQSRIMRNGKYVPAPLIPVDTFLPQDIFPAKLWNHTIPHTHPSHQIERYDPNYVDSIITKWSFLSTLYESDIADFIFVAGGAVTNAIVGRNNNGDCDMFIHIPYDYPDRLKKAEYVAITLQQMLIDNYNSPYICKTEQCFSIGQHHWRPEYQIIYRLYSCPSEILHGFDIGSCAVGFDGHRIYTTYLGKFALEYGYNILDTTRRSTSYEYRLNKYKKRGFGIIFPGMTTLAIWHAVPIKNFNIKLFKTIPCYQVTFGSRGGNSDYYQGSRWYQPWLNLMGLLKNRTDRMAIYSRNGTNWTIQDSGSFSDFIKSHSDMFRDQYCYRRNTNIWKFIKRGAQIYTKEEMKMIFIHYIDLIQDQSPATSLYSMPYVDTSQMNEFLTTLNENKLVKERRLMIQKLQKITFITDNPGRQLTSSVNPVFANPRDWYGNFYQSFTLYLPWSVIRLLAIAYRKNEGPFGMLPKDIIKYIIRLTGTASF